MKFFTYLSDKGSEIVLFVVIIRAPAFQVQLYDNLFQHLRLFLCSNATHTPFRFDFLIFSLAAVHVFRWIKEQKKENWKYQRM